MQYQAFPQAIMDSYGQEMYGTVDRGIPLWRTSLTVNSRLPKSSGRRPVQVHDSRVAIGRTIAMRIMVRRILE